MKVAEATILTNKDMTPRQTKIMMQNAQNNSCLFQKSNFHSKIMDKFLQKDQKVFD